MAKTPRVGLLDPSLGSRNAGDAIIREAVNNVVTRLGIDQRSLTVLPTQRPLTANERVSAAKCDKFLIGGTNLLSSNMPWYMQWKLRPRDLRLFKSNVMLLGVGWWQYQGHPNRFTTRALRRTLAPGGHSLRDSWSLQQLLATGLTGFNTSCPTLWDLSPKPERDRTPCQSVVVALTDYNRNRALDTRLLSRLSRHYETLALWPQGSKDARYIARIAPGAKVLAPGVEAFDAALREGFDYVGTRLHAGIRALQFGARSTIVAIDNRAEEIARDTSLPIVPRSLEGKSDELLFGTREVCLTLPNDAIERWIELTRHWLHEA